MVPLEFYYSNSKSNSIKIEVGAYKEITCDFESIRFLLNFEDN